MLQIPLRTRIAKVLYFPKSRRSSGHLYIRHISSQWPPTVWTQCTGRFPQLVPLVKFPTINHSSSSWYSITLGSQSVLSMVAAIHVHFPSRFTRQYNFAMYTRCIHWSINLIHFRYQMYRLIQKQRFATWIFVHVLVIHR